MSKATDELISAYLAELEREAARLPWNARSELLEDVRSHIEVAVADLREVGAGGWAGSGSRGDVSSGEFSAGVAGADLGSLDDLSPSADAAGTPDAGSADASSDGLGLGDASAFGSGDTSLPDLPSEVSAADIASPDSSPGEPTPADEISQVRAILAALGEPSEIVAAAFADDPSLAAFSPPPTEPVYPPRGPDPYYPPTRQRPPYPLGTSEVAAVALLLLGGFFVGVGWVIGVVLLWSSTRWSRREKLIGTLVLPGGIAGGLFAMTAARSGSYTNCSESGHCVTSGWSPPGWLTLTIVIVVVAAPAVIAYYLVNRARLRPGPAASGAAVAVIAGVSVVALLGVYGLLFVASTTTVVGNVTPVPADSSAGTAPGYAVPISSPAPPVSSESGP